MDRRLFMVRTFLLAAAGMVTAPLAGCGSRSGVGGEAGPEALAGFMLKDDAVIRLGHEYLAASPEEADPETLTGLLAAGLPDLDDPSARQTLLVKVKEDYAASRTVILSGWVLSVSESRLCALATLLAG
jgi:hypothetical protein